MSGGGEQTGNMAGGGLKYAGAAAALLIFSIYVYSLYGERLGGWWNLNNDHIIVKYLYPHNKLTLGEAAQKSTWVYYSVPGGPMYRPVYVFYHLAQVFAFGGEPTYYVIFRLSLMALSMFLWWGALYNCLGYINAMILALIMASHPFFAEMLGDGGPCELAGMIGLSVAMYSASRIMSRPESYGRQWLLVMLLGYLEAIGSKENFLFLFPLIIMGYYLAPPAMRKDKYSRAFLAAVTLLGLYFTLAVSYGLAKTGADIYGGTNPFSTRIEGLLWGFIGGRDMALKTSMYASVAVYAVLYYLRTRAKLLSSKIDPFLAEAGRFNKTAAALFAIWISQQFYYSGTLPTWMRYDFPAMLLLDMIMAAFLTGLVNVGMAYAGRAGDPVEPPGAGMAGAAGKRAPGGGAVKTALVAALLLAYFISTGGYSRLVEIKRQTHRYTEVSLHFKSQMDEMLKSSGSGQLVMVARYPNLDYESFLSLRVYLRNFGYKGSPFMVVDIPAGHKKTVLNDMLLKHMSGISMDGGQMFKPLRLFDEKKGYDAVVTQVRFKRDCAYCPGARKVYTLFPDKEIVMER